MSQEQSQEQKVVKLSQIKQDLENGLNRAKIAEKYGMDKASVKRIFAHPDLKYKKGRNPVQFILEDDVNPTGTVAATETAPAATPVEQPATPEAPQEQAPVEQPTTETPATEEGTTPEAPAEEQW